MSPSAPATEPGLRVSTLEETAVGRTLEVELPAQRVNDAFARAYRELAGRVRVRGFRPGKAPRSVLERLYGAALAEEIEERLVAESLPQALEQTGIEPVSEPRIEAPTPAADAPFRYTARVEVRPQITLPELSGLPGRRPAVEVGVADVETELEALRQRQAVLLEEPEQTPAREGHVLVLDFDGSVDGEPFEGGSGRGTELELGSGRYLPGFEDQLLGACSGEQREVRVTLPSEPPGPLAGKEATFQVRVLAIKRREVPELDDEFAKDLDDFESLDALRTRIREDLRAVREREADRALHRSLLDALIERVPLEVPPGLVERRLQARLAQAERELGPSLPEDALHGQMARWQQEWRPLAEREVREELLLDEVARAQGIEVQDGELDERLAAMAGDRPGERERLRRAYEKGGMLPVLRAAMARERALDFLRAKAKVETITDS